MLAAPFASCGQECMGPRPPQVWQHYLPYGLLIVVFVAATFQPWLELGLGRLMTGVMALVTALITAGAISDRDGSQHFFCRDLP